MQKPMLPQMKFLMTEREFCRLGGCNALRQIGRSLGQLPVSMVCLTCKYLKRDNDVISIFNEQNQIIEGLSIQMDVPEEFRGIEMTSDDVQMWAITDLLPKFVQARKEGTRVCVLKENYRFEFWAVAILELHKGFGFTCMEGFNLNELDEGQKDTLITASNKVPTEY